MPSQPGDTGTSRTIIVRVSNETHRALRIHVAKEDTSIQKWVEALVERELAVVGNMESASRRPKSSKR